MRPTGGFRGLWQLWVEIVFTVCQESGGKAPIILRSMGFQFVGVFTGERPETSVLNGFMQKSGTKISSGLMQRLLCVQRHQRSREVGHFGKIYGLYSPSTDSTPRSSLSWMLSIQSNRCLALTGAVLELLKAKLSIDHQSWVFPVFSWFEPKQVLGVLPRHVI